MGERSCTEGRSSGKGARGQPGGVTEGGLRGSHAYPHLDRGLPASGAEKNDLFKPPSLYFIMAVGAG